MNSFLYDCRHWVFDMDGTLTRPVHDFNYIRQKLEIPPQADILEHINGLPPKQAKAAHQWLLDHEYQLAANAELAPGADQLVQHLHQHKHSLAILTRNACSLVAVTLEAIGLSSYFQTSNIFGREQAAPKPSPAGMLKIASNWQVCPSKLTMVGDFHFDLSSARRAGSRSILVHEQGNLWPELNDLHTSSCLQLLQLLHNRNHHDRA